jgi:putative FmdB family regulatory protein
MPLYSFKCPKCGIKIEVIQSYKSPAPVCTYCDVEMQKQISAPGHFDLKGGGYYATDFKDKK